MKVGNPKKYFRLVALLLYLAVAAIIFYIYTRPEEQFGVDDEPADFAASLVVPELSTLDHELATDERFNATSRYAVAALIFSDDYTVSTLVLGHSLRKFNPGVDLVAGYVEELVTEETKCILRAGGWTLRRVRRIEPPKTPHNEPPFQFYHMFTKLRIWTWTEYERILYLDSDILCRGSITELFRYNLTFSACLDVYPWKLDTRMNMGVMLIKPNISEFRQLLYDSHRHKYKYSREFAEQAFLYYQLHSDVINLPYMYNVNLAFEAYDNFWDDLVAQARLIHYTYPKPFRQNRKGLFKLEPNGTSQIWYHDYDELIAQRGSEIASCGINGYKATRL